MSPRALLLGVDGGGTKTVAAIADREGAILGAGRAGGSNYQSSGEEGAARALREAIDQALRAAGASLSDVAAAGFGIAGADRAKERAIVEELVHRAAPVEKRFVENDALLILRAVTRDGVGVGLVAGTGTNCVSRARSGARLQVGGMGTISGDAGDAGDLALRAVQAAWRARDGRAMASALIDEVPLAAGVESIEQTADLWHLGQLPPPLVPRLVATLFREANAGDALARGVIEEVAENLAGAAVAALRTLALHGEDAVVALGGAMFQHEAHALLRDEVSRRIRSGVPGASVRVLSCAPVLGAVLFARDLLGPADAAFTARLLDEGRALAPIAPGAVT